MIRALRLLGFDAVLKAESGRFKDAIEQVLTTNKFIQLNLQSKFWMNYLIANILMRDLSVCLQRIVSERDINSESLKSIIEAWEPSLWRRSQIKSFQLERTMGLETALQALAGNYKFYDEFLEWRVKGELLYWALRPVLKTEVIWMLDTYDLMIRSAEQPYYSLNEFKEYNNRINSIPWYYITGRLLLPTIHPYSPY